MLELSEVVELIQTERLLNNKWRDDSDNEWCSPRSCIASLRDAACGAAYSDSESIEPREFVLNAAAWAIEYLCRYG